MSIPRVTRKRQSRRSRERCLRAQYPRLKYPRERKSVNKCECILSSCTDRRGPVPRSCYCRKIRFKFQSCTYRRPHINSSLLTGRYAERRRRRRRQRRRRRRRRGRRRGRRYSSCDGVNYRRRAVPWHLQHHRSFHGQIHWFQLHRRSRRL